MARCRSLSARSLSARSASTVCTGVLIFGTTSPRVVARTLGRPCGGPPVPDLYRSVLAAGRSGGVYCADGRLLPPVLPRRESHGAPRRAVDVARDPRARHRQPAVQRPPPRAAADVPDTALEAPAPAHPCG